MLNVKQKARKIFENRRVDKPSESKYFVLPTNSITTIIEENLSKLSITFVTTATKTIKELINTKQNNKT